MTVNTNYDFCLVNSSVRELEEKENKLDCGLVVRCLEMNNLLYGYGSSNISLFNFYFYYYELLKRME